MSSATRTNGAPLTGAPACPKCNGRMWDNRATKRNPRAPDFKCRDRSCDGVLWPGQHNAAAPIIAPRLHHDDGTGHEGEQGSDSNGTGDYRPRAGLRRCYLELTDFVLAEVRPKYQDAGVPCTDATVAAIAATMFIAACRQEGI